MPVTRRKIVSALGRVPDSLSMLSRSGGALILVGLIDRNSHGDGPPGIDGIGRIAPRWTAKMQSGPIRTRLRGEGKASASGLSPAQISSLHKAVSFAKPTDAFAATKPGKEPIRVLCPMRRQDLS